MIKAVIFDVDNTLYDFTKAHKAAFRALSAYAEERLGISREAFERLHRETQKELRAYMGETAVLHNRCIRYQAMLEKACLPLYPHVLEMNDLYWETLLTEAVPSVNARETMQMLKQRGIRIGIGTDMTARMQFRKLETLGMLAYVDFLVSSEEAGAEKPAPSFFARCAEKADCGKKECLFVGDSLRKDVLGALDAGMQAVWYCPGSPAEELEDVLRITDMRQLLETLSAL